MLRKTNPVHFLDLVLWPLLQLLWEPFSRKNSHFWHWRAFRGEVSGQVKIQGSPASRPRKSLWDYLWQTNFSWDNCIVFKPRYDFPYRIGYRSLGEGKTEMCSVILRGESAALIGGGDVEFFMVSLFGDNQMIDMNEEFTLRYCTKKQLGKGVILV
ncbi:MAG: hypothetical protein G01um101418_974 [Parcubacteria group bacterium Gr01-1014_18]|nr:MAG: hypothetical protein Greene041636_973 [Parcubacteria group bacterium Greene0416_36]TSC79514.1 MAG: hypothetical protein G01um101418_974 [Parcubacteria group bacterium Gr01-1014_18]TSC97820.1 MAG: hypothetical protein Greene101420_984 [Parcubacteria group bacterium Greene1014_20]TSD05953.1 MAG: hypothetical protein Greene07142_976 [Parcubacteria group bacterium Greene0714_2]